MTLRFAASIQTSCTALNFSRSRKAAPAASFEAYDMTRWTNPGAETSISAARPRYPEIQIT
jgi:hypothetical protein